MRFVILHYHIFKNAGSTVEEILDHSFGDRLGRLDTPVDGGLISNRDLVQYLGANPGLLAFSSHQIRYPLPEVAGYLFFDICFLRDPLDRLRSIYDYFRQKPNPADPMSALANRGGLGDFVSGMIENHLLFVRNNQVNLLACAGDSDEPDERDLDLATRRMLATSFLGVVDCFEQSAAAGTEALRSAFPELDCSRPPVNVSRGMQGTVASRTGALREACRPEVYEELLRITALDRQLVDRARKEVLRRFGEVRHQRTSRGTAPATLTPVPHESRAADPLTIARRFIHLAPYWRVLIGEGRATLFDAEYYGARTLFHFLVKGAFEGLQPHPLFDPAFYLLQYPDVAASGVNPLCHYLKYGRAELRQPHPLFDPVFYLDRNPDVRRAGLDPLLHYIRHGAAEDRKPHPLFDPVHYRAAYRQELRPGQNPLVHFLNQRSEASNPHPLFDCEAYVDAHPCVAERDVNPLVHYLVSGGNQPASSLNEPASSLNEPASSVNQPASSVVGDASRHQGGLMQLEIQDVRLTARVWQDDRGLTHWIAEPQQLPFLRALGINQFRAQIPESDGT